MLELHDIDCCALLRYLLHIVGDRFNQLGFRWCMRERSFASHGRLSLHAKSRAEHVL